MGRAALVASELRACWAVAWADLRDTPTRAAPLPTWNCST
ncbi:hypothetical protein BJ997_003963 [Cryobacterium roopkundense]|uniref:Uncharacterized protein n=1 Tax=Cryobacterium roopkundense TaxID=1001240 RepID=A0A7W9A0M9_9MICO|nr:hypothetical protein [Cryobacterium roopkundense]